MFPSNQITPQLIEIQQRLSGAEADLQLAAKNNKIVSQLNEWRDRITLYFYRNHLLSLREIGKLEIRGTARVLVPVFLLQCAVQIVAVIFTLATPGSLYDGMAYTFMILSLLFSIGASVYAILISLPKVVQVSLKNSVKRCRPKDVSKAARAIPTAKMRKYFNTKLHNYFLKDITRAEAFYDNPDSTKPLGVDFKTIFEGQQTDVQTIEGADKIKSKIEIGKDDLIEEAYAQARGRLVYYWVLLIVAVVSFVFFFISDVYDLAKFRCIGANCECPEGDQACINVQLIASAGYIFNLSIDCALAALIILQGFLYRGLERSLTKNCATKALFYAMYYAQKAESKATVPEVMVEK